MAVGFVLGMMIFASGVPGKEPREQPEYDARYESRRLSSIGAFVVYKLYGAAGEPDRLEITVTEKALDHFTYVIKTYSGDRLVEEKTEKGTLGDTNRQFFPSELHAQGIEFSKGSEIINKTVYPTQRFRSPDGSVEVYSQQIPAGGLLKKMDPSGRVLWELVEMKTGKDTDAAISQIKKDTSKSVIGITAPLSISDLSQDIRKKRQEQQGRASSGKRVVINEESPRVALTPRASSFLEEVSLANGVPSERFASNILLLQFGFERPQASAQYYLIESTEPAIQQTPESHANVTITFAESIASLDEKTPPRALFTIDQDGKTTSTKIEITGKGIPGMKGFEFLPEVVTVPPGAFSCFHIRFVIQSPLKTIVQEGKIQTTTITDKKIDYWVSNVSDCTVVVRKIEAERKQKIQCAADEPSVILSQEDVTKVKKWSLVNFSPVKK
jgi:hypothetical protein